MKDIVWYDGNSDWQIWSWSCIFEQDCTRASKNKTKILLLSSNSEIKIN